MACPPRQTSIVFEVELYFEFIPLHAGQGALAVPQMMSISESPAHCAGPLPSRNVDRVLYFAG